MPTKSGLGKGLDALIPGGSSFQSQPQPAERSSMVQPGSEGQGVQQVRVDKIRPNPHQPRTHFDPVEMEELAASVREHGVLQPLLVTIGEKPGEYILIAGERRLLASRQAGLKTVPVIVREASEQQRVELALIENVQRADLGPLETAEAYRQLGEMFGMGHEKIAERVGKSRTAVTNTLRLLKLPAAVQQALADGKVSEGHARALLALPSSQAQAAALQSILKNDLNVRQTEELVRKLSGQKPVKAPSHAPEPEVAELENRLRHGLGTKVTLNHHAKGGTLVIHYYSDEELNALVTRILDENPQ